MHLGSVFFPPPRQRVSAVEEQRCIFVVRLSLLMGFLEFMNWEPQCWYNDESLSLKVKSFWAWSMLFVSMSDVDWVFWFFNVLFGDFYVLLSLELNINILIWSFWSDSVFLNTQYLCACKRLMCNICNSNEIISCILSWCDCINTVYTIKEMLNELQVLYWSF